MPATALRARQPIDTRDIPSVTRAFEELRTNGDAVLRDQLVEAHLGIAFHLARRFDHRGVPLDDLRQIAAVALVDAVDRYDPSAGAAFSSFATPTVLGELKRYFRDKTWGVRVPRRLQELSMKVDAAVESLTQDYGRSPTVAEISTSIGATEEETIEAMDAGGAYHPKSLDAPVGAGGTLGQLVGYDDENVAAFERHALLESLVAHLSPDEYELVRLRFIEDLSQAEIATRLGVSQMQVSRMLRRCLDRMRAFAG